MLHHGSLKEDYQHERFLSNHLQNNMKNMFS